MKKAFTILILLLGNTALFAQMGRVDTNVIDSTSRNINNYGSNHDPDTVQQQVNLGHGWHDEWRWIDNAYTDHKLVNATKQHSYYGRWYNSIREHFDYLDKSGRYYWETDEVWFNDAWENDIKKLCNDTCIMQEEWKEGKWVNEKRTLRNDTMITIQNWVNNSWLNRTRTITIYSKELNQRLSRDEDWIDNKWVKHSFDNYKHLTPIGQPSSGH